MPHRNQKRETRREGTKTFDGGGLFLLVTTAGPVNVEWLRSVRLSAACVVLDSAFARPSVCTETDNDDDILFANLFGNGHDEAGETGTA